MIRTRVLLEDHCTMVLAASPLPERSVTPVPGDLLAEESRSSGFAESRQRLLPAHFCVREDRLEAWIVPQ